MEAQIDNAEVDPQPSSPNDAAHSNQASSSSSQPRFISTNPFRRASSSLSSTNMLARLTGAKPFRAQAPAEPSADATEQRPSIGRRLSSRRKSAEPSGANLAELSRPNGKFKSGIKAPQQTPEPFMEASDTTAAERELAATLQAQAALASGSTAAAQVHAQTRGLGEPIFSQAPSISSPSNPSSSPTDSSQTLPTVLQTMSAIGNSGINPDILIGGASEPKPHSASPTALESSSASDDQQAALKNEAITNGDAAGSDATPPNQSIELASEDQASTAGDNHMLARAAQLVLEAARQQARVETRKKGRSAPASPKRTLSSLSPITTSTSQDTSNSDSSAAPAHEETEGLARTPSQRARSKSDAGGDGQIKRRKSFLRSMSSKARRNKTEASSNEGSEDQGSDTPTQATPSGTSSGTTTPGGRRRRYVDTRDLDLLARELAAESIAEQMPQPPFARPSRSGSSSPLRNKPGATVMNDPRRRSFPSIQEDLPLQDDSISASPIPTSASGLKPMTPMHPTRAASRTRAADCRIASNGLPGLLADPTNGMVPKEMLLGLGGSPYPSLPNPAAASNYRSTIDNLDPFGIPLTQESSPFDATMAYANKTSVYHSPNQVVASHSQSAYSSLSGSSTSLSTKRRPVLTMTMNDPAAELQGLTKPPKESKRLTPFGSRSNSRANSRANSPNASYANLKEAAAQQKQVSGPADVKSTSEGPATENKDDAAVTLPVDSMTAAEPGNNNSLSVPKSGKKNRLSQIFRTNKAKVPVEAATPNDSSVNTPAATPLHTSAYATPAAEASASIVSPTSAAVSLESDQDISPVAFKTLDLPTTRDSSISAGALPRSVSRASVATDMADKPAQKKRPIQAFLRRLSSFSKKSDEKEAIKQSSTKITFPDASTMPVVDMERLKALESEGASLSQASIEREAGTADAGVKTPKNDGTATEADASVEAGEAGLAPALSGLDLSHAAPAPLNEEMAKNGFGTRSAYNLGSSTDSPVTNAEGGVKQEDSAKEMGDGWERARTAQVARTDSETPSSEDSFFLGSGPSVNSRPGSGALMKHGSESAISEELHTPDPSTAHLPTSMKGYNLGRIDQATLGNVTAVTAATVAANVVAKASGENSMVTALPNQRQEGRDVALV